MTKRKSTKGQTTLYKTHTQNWRSSNTNPTKNRGWTQWWSTVARMSTIQTITSHLFFSFLNI